MARLFKFGAKPALRELKTLSFTNYGTPSKISFPPVCAWERPIELGELGNATVGDCTVAGWFHVRMIQRAVAQAGNPLIVTDDEALSEYSKITGYVPGDPSTDSGAYLLDVLKYFKAKYVSVDVQNIDAVKAANFLFGGLYIGFDVPQSMVDQMEQGLDPDWKFYPNDKRSGEGHCIDPCGHGRRGFAAASWGKYVRPSWDFWQAWVTECYGIVNEDWIKASGVSPSGFDMQGLLNDLQEV